MGAQQAINRVNYMILSSRAKALTAPRKITRTGPSNQELRELAITRELIDQAAKISRSQAEEHAQIARAAAQAAVDREAQRIAAKQARRDLNKQEAAEARARADRVHEVRRARKARAEFRAAAYREAMSTDV